MAHCFLACQLTNLLQPELLSIGLVDLAGAEHYVELDLDTDIGEARLRTSSEVVRWSGVLDQWGLLEGSKVAPREMGRRTGEWLLQPAHTAGGRVEVCYDYDPNFELLDRAVREAGLWDQLSDVVRPTNVSALICTVDGELAAEECLRGLSGRGLRRHHALADALALRAAYVAVQDGATAFSRFVRTDGFRRLVEAAGGREWESWTRKWLLQPAHGLGRRPLDIAREPDGIAILADHLGRIGNG
jgi:hypothetical protein